MRLAGGFCACCLLSLALRSAHVFGAEQERLVIIVPVADMYSSSSVDSDVVSQAIYGTTVLAMESKNAGWVRIQTPDRYWGWIASADARSLSAQDSYASSGKPLQVNSLTANLYREPDVTAHRPLLTLPYETRLEFIERDASDSDWLKVRLPDGRLAWIQAGDTIPDPRALTVAESIELGKRFLGVTYTWGGRSSFGFDCSGFTQMLVRSRGINMPRDADLQAAWDGAAPVDRKDLREGDLLFFGSSADHITHTGMFIGNGQFIHDTTYGHPGVQISRLDDQPWTRLLVASRRVK